MMSNQESSACDVNPAPEPLTLNFETCTMCNAECTFCMHQEMKRRGRAKWSSLIDIMYWHAPNAKVINPFGMQEPTLEPRLAAVLSNCKMFNRKAQTVVYSNMGHYDESTWRRIIWHNTLDELHISFYGVDKRMYNRLQPGLDYYQVQRNIKRLMRLRRRMRWRKPHVTSHLLVTSETLPHAEKFERKWSAIVDEVGFVHYDAWCGSKPYDLEQQRRIWGKPSERRVPCHRLWNTLVVHYDGSVVPCCLDYDDSMVMGNIHDDRDTFTGDRFNELRRLHVEGKQDEVPLCKDCSLWLYETPKEWGDFWLGRKHVASAVTR